MKNIHATHEWTKNFFYENQPCYERLETLVTQKPAIGGEDDFSSIDLLWNDTSLKLKDGDVITFHITDVTFGGEEYISVPLYCDNSISDWGDKGFDTNLGGAWFGYNGIVDENNLYIGVRLVVPPLFSGTVEIGGTVLKQIDEKFIPNSIARKSDVVSVVDYTKLGNATVSEANETSITIESGTIQKGDILLIKGALNGKIEEFTAAVPSLGAVAYGEILSAEIGRLNFVGYNTIWFTEGIEGTVIEVYKQVVNPIIEELKYTYEPVKIGEGEPLSNGRALVYCSEDINEGDTIMVKSYFEDGIETYVIEDIKYSEVNNKYIIASSLGRLGDVYLDNSFVRCLFNCTVKGEVYKYKKRELTQVVEENKYTNKPFKIGEGVSTEEDIIPGVSNFNMTSYTRGPAEEDAVVGNNSPYCITISEQIPAEDAQSLIGKPIQIVNSDAQDISNSIITTEIMGIGEDYSTLFLNGSCFPSPIPFTPGSSDKIYSAKLVVECSVEIKEGDILLLRSYSEDGVEENSVTVPKLEAGTVGIKGDNGFVLLRGANHNQIVFAYGTKGVVYKFSEFPISEATTELYDKVDKIEEELNVKENVVLADKHVITAEELEDAETFTLSEVINEGDTVEYSLFNADDTLAYSGSFVCPNVAMPQTDQNNVTIVLQPGYAFVNVFGGNVKVGMKVTLTKPIELSIKEVITEIDTALNNIISKYGLGGDA